MLTVTKRRLGGATLLSCDGRLYREDLRCLQEALRDHGHGGLVVLDLAKVEVVDAGGLGVLVAVQLLADGLGAHLRLMNLTPAVERLLDMTNLRSIFTVSSVREMMELLCYAAAPPCCNERPSGAHAVATR